MNRITDERLAEIQAEHDALEPQHITDDWFYWEEMPGNTTKEVHQHRGELIQALKAERLYAASLEGKLSAADILEEARLKRIRELEAKLERVSKLPKKWREDREEQRSVGCRHWQEAEYYADELQEALADD